MIFATRATPHMGRCKLKFNLICFNVLSQRLLWVVHCNFFIRKEIVYYIMQYYSICMSASNDDNNSNDNFHFFKILVHFVKCTEWFVQCVYFVQWYCTHGGVHTNASTIRVWRIWSIQFRNGRDCLLRGMVSE